MVNAAVSFIGYLINGWCGRGCDFEAPYGFVPEAGCPIHNSEIRLHRLLRWGVLKVRPLPIFEPKPEPEPVRQIKARWGESKVRPEFPVFYDEE